MPKKIIFFISSISSFLIIGLFFLFFNKTNIAYAQSSCTTSSGQSCSSVGGVCDGFGNCYYNGMTCLNSCSNPFDLNRCQRTGSPRYNSCSTLFTGGGSSQGLSFCCYNPVPTPTPTPSCVGSVGGNCNSTPCCSPLVCTAIDIYTRQCKGTPSTPTPTPSQKFLIRGVVYNDKNNNGVVDGNDTAFDGTRPGAPFVTTSELLSGSFKYS